MKMDQDILAQIKVTKTIVFGNISTHKVTSEICKTNR